MRRVQLLPPAFFVLFGGYIMWESLFRMTYYNYARGAPGPGFLPFWLALGLIAFGLHLLVGAVRDPQAEVAERQWTDASGLKRIGFVVAALLVFFLAFERLGFIVTATLFMAIVSYGLGIRSWKIFVPVSLLVGIGLYLLFSTWLEVSLPAGVLVF